MKHEEKEMKQWVGCQFQDPIDATSDEAYDCACECEKRKR